MLKTPSANNTSTVYPLKPFDRNALDFFFFFCETSKNFPILANLIFFPCLVYREFKERDLGASGPLLPNTHFSLAGFNEDNMEQTPSALRHCVNKGGMKAGKGELVRGLENINWVFPGENSLMVGGGGVVAIQCSVFSVFVFYCKRCLSEWEMLRWVKCGHVKLNYTRIYIFYSQHTQRFWSYGMCLCASCQLETFL